jgi:glutathione synthase/RimK-type ligase-like ATP-grasp enzyme
MILILTTEAGDFSHVKIIDWLSYMKANFMIIAGERILSGEDKLVIKKDEIYFNDVNLSKEITCVFYRRWITSSEVKISEDTYLNESLNRNLISELYEIRNFLFTNLIKAKWFPNADSVNVNKLSVLQEAKKIGINVPEYIVTNRKEELLNFYKKCDKKLITKAIGNFQKCYTANGTQISAIYTKIVDDNVIKQLPNNFFISIFQKQIVKTLEYRVLYFNKKCYATAILSQENELTTVDSRKNNFEIESRLVPISIDMELEHKIIKLMTNLRLSIGSLDFIHASDNKNYFLEVNPVGQVGGYSERCLLDFEKDVVEHLIKIDNLGKNNRQNK